DLLPTFVSPARAVTVLRTTRVAGRMNRTAAEQLYMASRLPVECRTGSGGEGNRRVRVLPVGSCRILPHGPLEVPAVRVKLSTVAGHFGAVVHGVIAQDAGDADPVVREHLAASQSLGHPVLFLLPPGVDGLFVAPERQRQQLARLIEAFEALDRNKTVD